MRRVMIWFAQDRFFLKSDWWSQRCGSNGSLSLFSRTLLKTLPWMVYIDLLQIYSVIWTWKIIRIKLSWAKLLPKQKRSIFAQHCTYGIATTSYAFDPLRCVGNQKQQSCAYSCRSHFENQWKTPPLTWAPMESTVMGGLSWLVWLNILQGCPSG